MFYQRVSLCTSWRTVLLFLFFIFDKMEKFKEQGANQDISCNASIDDTVKFVYGHKVAFIEISRGNCITDPRGFKYQPF